ncbi:MAG: PspC domain-containing protein [Lachnospiraceae bacterium]|nr:PspC domain-containing protein [Lachnospiraceae bacterium]
MSKRLYKSREKKLAGVCGGIAEYFDIDPTIIRIVWLIFVLCAGTGLLAYIIAAIVMPDQPDNMDNIQ